MSYASMSNTRFITRTALLAALYVVITYAFSFLSYQAVQFRISEVLMLLIFMDRRYLASLLLGCFLANLIGPFGLPDAVFGSLSTLVAGVLMIAIRRHLGNGPKALFLATLMPALGNGITAASIAIMAGTPQLFWYNWLTIALGEIGVVTVLGIPFFHYCTKNEQAKHFLELR